jgi:hypothetical protein
VAAPSQTNSTTNQKLGYQQWGGIFDEILPRWKVGGGQLPVFFNGNSSDKKFNEKKSFCGHRWSPNDEETCDNQSEDSVGDGGRYYDEMRLWRNV